MTFTRLACRRPGRTQRSMRRGSAVVEMAVVTPLLLTMVFGVIEFGWVLMVRETLTNATREACRVAVLGGSTEAEIRERFNQAASHTGITFDTGMLTIARATPGNPIETVTVTVPRERVSLVGGYFNNLIPGFTGGNVTSTCSMRKEGSI